MWAKRLWGAALAAVVLLLGGCFDDSLDFTIRFDDLAGLQEQDRVYFQQNEIGVVEGITYTSGGAYLVKVAIGSNFQNAATVDSRFFIGFDPGERRRKAVIVVQESTGGRLIQENSTVEGSRRPGYLSEIISGLQQTAEEAESELRRALDELQRSLQAGSARLDAQLSETISELSRRFEIFREEAGRIPESEQVRQLEESLRRFVEQFNEAGTEVRRRIEEEYLPQLRRELEALRRQLDKEGRGEEMEELDRQMERIIVV